MNKPSLLSNGNRADHKVYPNWMNHAMTRIVLEWLSEAVDELADIWIRTVWYLGNCDRFVFRRKHNLMPVQLIRRRFAYLTSSLGR
jgi:hypothetical protein